MGSNMHYNYNKYKSDDFIKTIWYLTEDLQDEYPYLLMGWYGFSGWYMDT